jgi:hypothetical protein
MRRLLWLPALLALALPVRSATPVAVSIRQFGLGGVYSVNAGPTWVQVAVRNNGSRAVSLHLKVAELNLDAGALPMTESPSFALTLEAGEERVVDAAMNIFPGDPKHTVIYAEATGPDGFPLGRAGRVVGPSNQDRLIAVLCSTADGCKAVRQRILLSGTPEEQQARSESTRLVQLPDPPAVAWAYGRANLVVVATPVSSLSPAQRDALELYMLAGGGLVLVEDQLADPLVSPQLLAAYRTGVPEGRVFPAGAGHFVHVASASNSAFLNYLFPPQFSARSGEQRGGNAWSARTMAQQGEGSSELPWIMKRTGTTFRFPSFMSLLLWILAYLACAGLLNFVILRRFRRPEWAWATIPSFAVLFSLILYMVSVRTHPSKFGTSEVVVYRMTDLSALSQVSARIRVSSPSRSALTLSMPREVSFRDPRGYLGMFDTPALFRSSNFWTPADIAVEKKWEMRFALRRWSFRDLDFVTGHRFPGTVRRDAQGLLHNDTAVAFDSALVAKEGAVFLLGNLPAGGVVDLSKVERRDYRAETGRTLRAIPYPGPPFAHEFSNRNGEVPADRARSFQLEYEALAAKPFSPLELIRGWPEDGSLTFSETKAVFFGIGGAPSLGPELPSRSPSQSSSSLVVVTFGEWP